MLRTEALEDFMQRDYPRLQILTIREVFAGRTAQLPPRYNPYRLAEHRASNVTQTDLFDRRASG